MSYGRSIFKWPLSLISSVRVTIVFGEYSGRVISMFKQGLTTIFQNGRHRLYYIFFKGHICASSIDRRMIFVAISWFINPKMWKKLLSMQFWRQKASKYLPNLKCYHFACILMHILWQIHKSNRVAMHPLIILARVVQYSSHDSQESYQQLY